MSSVEVMFVAAVVGRAAGKTLLAGDPNVRPQNTIGSRVE
jgi:hypothetical protein